MDLSPYIKELISFNECVIVRNIGGFETLYREAVLDEQQNIIRPPGKVVEFHPDWIKDNGILEDHLVSVLKISREKAAVMIDEFVMDVKSRLSRDGSVTLEQLGKFTLHGDQEISFVPFEDENYFADSFGLDTLSFDIPPGHGSKPVQRRKLKRSTEPVRLRSTFLYFLLGLLVFLISVTGLVILISNARTGILDIADEFFQTRDSETVTFGGDGSASNDTIRKSIEQRLDQKTSVRQALSINPPVQNQTIADKKTYYIVGGSFNTFESANILKHKLQRQGFEPIVLVMGEHVRVILSTHTDEQDALNELRRIRNDYDQSVWLLKE